MSMDRLRRAPSVAREHRSTAREHVDDPLELAGAIGNTAMQAVAGSPELGRSPAAVRLLSRTPATLARRTFGEEDDGEGVGFGTGTAMDDWLWEQQGWGERQKQRADEAERWIIEHANDWPAEDEGPSPEDDELWRREGARPFS